MNPALADTVPLYLKDSYQQQFAAQIVAIGEQAVALDQTLFYPIGGGQPGDTGSLTLLDGTRINVQDTRRDLEQRGLIWHYLETMPPGLQTGASVQGAIDWQRRYQHMKMHTCLHLLCAVLPAPVTGCNIGSDKGRVDFDLPEMEGDKDSLSAALNQLIRAAHPVATSVIPAADYAAALEMARTQSVAPPQSENGVRVINIPGVDSQPCGGTHVANTAEIGEVVVDKIEKKSKHNRRVVVRFVSEAG